MKIYQLSEMMNELGYKDADSICERRKEERSSLGFHTYDCNLWSVSEVMDFSTGRFDHFTSTCLIVADRLFEYGIGLAYYLQTNTGANVLGIVDEYNSEYHIEQDIDFVIFCGYQKSKTNYQMIEDMRRWSNPPQIIMVARLDTLISEICHTYNITHTYDRYCSLSGFIKYMSAVLHCPRIRITEEKEPAYEETVNKPVYRTGIMDTILNLLRNNRRSTAKSL